MEFTGTWHIYEMSNWDDEYFNMEVQAYIEIDEQGNGEFQFGLVHGYIDGDIVKDGNHLFPVEFIKGDSYGALRYRFQWQLANCLQQRPAIAL
jgi:hypothetical protein